MVKTKIVNVVATASICQKLVFYELRKRKEIFHDSDVYGGRVAYFKTEKMQGRVSIFASGKMISVGTKSETQAHHELELAARFLINEGFAKPIELTPKTQNMVITADFEESLNLEKLSEDSKAIYEPEQFPGGILRISDPYKATILIFASGKTVITGLRNSNHIKPVTEQLANIIRECSS
jgi:TATA-box binding protein (TBP) (component of TFIID and TFIIIB)